MQIILRKFLININSDICKSYQIYLFKKLKSIQCSGRQTLGRCVKMKKKKFHILIWENNLFLFYYVNCEIFNIHDKQWIKLMQSMPQILIESTACKLKDIKPDRLLFYSSVFIRSRNCQYSWPEFLKGI